MSLGTEETVFWFGASVEGGLSALAASAWQSSDKTEEKTVGFVKKESVDDPVKSRASRWWGTKPA